VTATPPPWSELIALGKRKGYVTYEDVHRAMPDYVQSKAAIDRWLVALSEHGIEIRDEPEPIRSYDAERVRSAQRTGRAIGPLFVQNLLDLAARETPISYPCGGMYCRAGETTYTAVHFSEGLTSAVGSWLARAEVADAALLVFVGRRRDVELILASCDGTPKSDVTCRFRISVQDDRIKTSLPGCELERVGTDVSEAFIAGVRAGMAEHPRAGELGFGELGDYAESTT
jgi:hypothetical protein